MTDTSRSTLASVRVGLGRHGEVFLLFALAALVFQPWNTPGLPILDFSEFLPHLAAHSSFWARFRSVADYLATQGRFSPLQYLYVDLTWSAFGVRASGWHWTYFVINAGVLVAARSVLLRMGVRRSAALVTIALWAVMKPFAEGWLRPTGETIGLLFLLAGLRLALDYGTVPNWRPKAVAIAACVLAAVFTKEMLVVLVPVIWLTSRIEMRDGVTRWARWTPRDTFLAIVLVMTLVIALAPIAYVALHAPAGNYASRYGSEGLRFATTLERFEISFFPGSERLSSLTRVMGDPAWRLLLVLPNLVWLALIADGMTTPSARRKSWVLLIGVAWLLAGVIAYVPWPGRAGFYMLPFAFGTVIIAAHALTWLFDRSARVGRVGVVTAWVLVGITAVEARNLVHIHELRVRLDSSIIESLSRVQGLTNVIAAVPDPARDASRGWARRLTDFGRVVNGMPPVHSIDVSCNEGRAGMPRIPGTAVVSEQEGCGMIVPQSRKITVLVPERRWPTLLTIQRFYRTGFVATYQPEALK